MTYIATFHTHFGALCLHRELKNKGVTAQMMPVPRSLSASCGVCVRFEDEKPDAVFGAEDMEAVYQEEKNGYTLVRQFD